MHTREEYTKSNLVGVIPVSGRPNQLGSLVPDCCFLIGHEYAAIERSVLECAYAGCSSIWVVCSDKEAPLIKEIIGDYIINPDSYRSLGHVRYPREHLKYISIFYTPIHPKDRDRRDSLGWSALYGCLAAFRTSSRISSWLAPKKYYISFPCGIYNPEHARENRMKISSKTENFYFSHNKQTVRDNLQIGFTLFPSEWQEIRRTLKQNCTGGNRAKPIHERWSSRNFTLDKIFKNDIINIHQIVEVGHFAQIDDWDSYLLSTQLFLRKDKNKPVITGLKYEGLYIEN